MVDPPPADVELALASALDSELNVSDRLLVARRVLERALAARDLLLERQARSAILALLPGLVHSPAPHFIIAEAQHHAGKIADAFPNTHVARIEQASVLSLEGRFPEAADEASEGLDLAIAEATWHDAAAAAMILLAAQRRTDVAAPGIDLGLNSFSHVWTSCRPGWRSTADS
jgi:hypothetical protein